LESGYTHSTGNENTIDINQEGDVHYVDASAVAGASNNFIDIDQIGLNNHVHTHIA